ncbi:MAG: peptidoglycan DD-metalloendopeptidase family protein [Cyanobacteria bacterium P01_G01_bin.38]
MKRTNSQEPTADSSHSCLSAVVGFDDQVSSGSNGRATSAAMLGIALSMGASGVLLADSEASAAVDVTSTRVSVKSLQSLSRTSTASSLQRSFSAQPKPQAETVYHTVEDGESLWQIAQRHRVAVKDIKVANRIPAESPLQVGQVLKVPADEVANQSVHTQPGNSAPSSTLLALTQEGPASDATVANSKPSKLSSMLEDVASVELARELPNPAPAPAPIVPAAAVDQETLRSAGLMTQADGFQQELDQIEVDELALGTQAEQPTAEPNVPVVATLSPASPQQDYRVQAGDTLGSIARSLGVTPDQLAQANGLGNPDFILAGENLVIPEPAWGGNNQPSVSVPVVIAPAPAPEASEVVSVDKGDNRLARLQSTVHSPVNASTVMNRLRGQQAEFTSEAAVPEADPYTASLINQVESVRDRADVIAEPEPIAIGGPDQDESALALVKPDFQSRLSGSTVDSSALDSSALNSEVAPQTSRPEPQLLAAAPLSPDAYAPPSASPATGQVVSPDMPVLPDSEEYLPDAPNYFNGYIWPTRGTVTSGYGWRWGRMHRGVDVAGPVGTPIVASAPGVVERSGWNSGGYGNLVEIRHADGSMTRYAHNSRLIVRPGQQVDQGQQIAEMGSTGYSTGPHLHFEVHLPNQGTVNPVAYLPSR